MNGKRGATSLVRTRSPQLQTRHSAKNEGLKERTSERKSRKRGGLLRTRSGIYQRHAGPQTIKRHIMQGEEKQ